MATMVACGGGTSAASHACSELKAGGDGAAIVNAAIAKGAQFSDIAASCPDLASKVYAVPDAAKDARGVTVELGSCDGGEVSGTITNDNDAAVDAVVHYELFSSSNTRIDDGLVPVVDLSPGQTAQWREPLADDLPAYCNATLDSSRPA